MELSIGIIYLKKEKPELSKEFSKDSNEIQIQAHIYGEEEIEKYSKHTTSYYSDIQGSRLKKLYRDKFNIRKDAEVIVCGQFNCYKEDFSYFAYLDGDKEHMYQFTLDEVNSAKIQLEADHRYFKKAKIYENVFDDFFDHIRYGRKIKSWFFEVFDRFLYYILTENMLNKLLEDNVKKYKSVSENATEDELYVERCLFIEKIKFISALNSVLKLSQIENVIPLIYFNLR